MATKKATKATEVKEVKAVEAAVEAPKAEKKAPAKKAAVKKETVITVQYQGNEVAVASVEEKVKAAFVAEGHKASSIKELSIYVKPEEFAAYYVINEKYTGHVDLF